MAVRLLDTHNTISSSTLNIQASTLHNRFPTTNQLELQLVGTCSHHHHLLPAVDLVEQALELDCLVVLLEVFFLGI